MVSMPDREDYTMHHYPDPYSSAPVPMGIDSYAPYAQRSAHDGYHPTTVAYDPHGAMYAPEPAQTYIYHHPGRSSPGTFPEDGDNTGGSSNMSSVSASSSTMGSPLSNPGQLSTMQEWPPHGLGVSPSIVDQSDYFPGAEYSLAPEMNGFPTPTFEWATSKPPGFVGELSKIPRSSLSSSPCSILSSPTLVGQEHGTSGVGLAINTRLAQASVPMSPTPTSASSARTNFAFLSPHTSSSTCFSSPPAPVWKSPGRDDLSPLARPRIPRNVPPFFSQSSGHFVPPLESSCWFPLSNRISSHGGLTRTTLLTRVARVPDPSLIHPDVRTTMAMAGYEYPQTAGYHPASPALSASPQIRNGSTSPFLSSNYQQYSPFQPPVDPQGRRPSIVSFHSNYSGDESKEKQRCPHPDCGKIFKDLKAHMLTHQNERPEKCPIVTCEYHVKGFARKYDKNRHTLTHYKGTMVCGFCPGSGSAAEKSFNRADVFKRHLTAVHGVEQTPPNSRRKTTAGLAGNASKSLKAYAPDATGKCSTCSQTFSNAQDFYEHLDDCVLRIVQQEDPAEAINAQCLAEVENDREVHTTLEKNQLPTTTMASSTSDEDEDEDMAEDDDQADDDAKAAKLGRSPNKSKGGQLAGSQKSRGMTHSRGGVPLVGKNRGRKNRRDYPSSWGFDKGQMTMKKRVMAVFDGPRRLAKDDMMLSTEHEVRVKLSDGKSYVTDLDMQTLKRAEGFLGATEEEKGPWISDDPTEEDLKKMLECSS